MNARSVFFSSMLVAVSLLPVAGYSKTTFLPPATDNAAKWEAYTALSGYPEVFTQLKVYAKGGNRHAAYGIGVYYQIKANLTNGKVMFSCGGTELLKPQATQAQYDQISKDLDGVISQKQKTVNQLCHKSIVAYRRAGSMGDARANYQLALMEMSNLVALEALEGSDQGDPLRARTCSGFARYLKLASNEHSPGAEAMLAVLYNGELQGKATLCHTALHSDQSSPAKIATLIWDACQRGDGSECAEWAGVLNEVGETSEATKWIELAARHKDSINGACAIALYYQKTDTSTGKAGYWRNRCAVLTARKGERYPAYQKNNQLGSS